MAEEVAGKTGTLTEKKSLHKIIVTSHPIFDESDPDSFFIHDWANYLHINTQESTILYKLTFTEQSIVSQKDIEEAQRNLRSEPYIRDAKISFAERDPDADAPDEGEVVLVETWDNWSLLPTVSVGRSGGDSKFSIGLKEDNLLGLGIRTRIKYKSTNDRTGYKFAVKVPVDRLIEHSTIAASFHDNSDGQATQFRFDKPFYTLDTTNMYGVSYLDDFRTDTIRQNGMNINEFEHKQDYFNLQYGWRVHNTPNSRTRLIAGITRDRNEFANLDNYPDTTLPKSRNFLYPWVAYEYLQDDYKVLNNVHLINYNEDFNLGWHHYFKLGFETEDLGDSSLGYHIDWKTTRGYQGNQDLILLSFDGIGIFSTQQKDVYQVNAMAEYFYQISPKWTAYAKSRLSTSKNNYLDKTFALGDDTGIRGYPNDYQHGDNQWLFTAELRNYPNINLYQLAELGWAAFVDVGQATGGQDAGNEISGPIGSVGIGARIYSSRSSYGNVAHIDISMPFTTGVEVNEWEWRFIVKNRF
ncbi:hypothetical protein HWQ46_18030 [Shewanella sp. D64]|uniref:ShlB/FhaC/HecB family hemolysin secretion/activation protein n=1 Tax=unclassified Shewanella TaxID=196818 RepID=UPI0022BA28E1|nr:MULTISPECIES: hypothetical protein [unclassified Shewanella]MEC4727446.1 hypothetical protein [Shewanella sp. D64]MEC4739601.1 hypothetical protein [Shewanella sp. E94]WBJ98065.1 hypothetical protein HWQ47_02465 [Shewanella sp. MTB7]